MLTPWNNLMYNSDPNNLAIHGLHPRYHHLLINFPIMFGPLCIIFVVLLFNRIKLPTNFYTRSPDHSVQAFFLASAGSVLFGLTLLSFAPHQEPRFLLPMLVPLSLLCGHYISLPTVRSVWIVFNIALAVFMGYLHQAGVIPACIQTHSLVTSQSPNILFYGTYTAPRSLIMLHPWQHDQAAQWTVQDISPQLLQDLDQYILSLFHNNSHPEALLYISAPAAHNLLSSYYSVDLHWEKVTHYFPHWSSEDMPSPQYGNLWSQLVLECYRITPANKT